MDASATPTKKPKGAFKLLADLPSKGLFSSSVVSSNLGGMRVYITDRDTSPPENQLIKTDQMNILIRSLLLKQQHKAESSAKGAGGKEGSRKRALERGADGRATTKRAASNAQHCSQPGYPGLSIIKSKNGNQFLPPSPRNVEVHHTRKESDGTEFCPFGNQIQHGMESQIPILPESMNQTRLNNEKQKQEGSRSHVPENLQSLTVERIRALLKERGLSLKGKKDELIRRLRSATG